MLVVDDNATNRRILEEMLTSWRMQPQWSPTADGGAGGAAGARPAAGEPFRLVLLDAMMPEMDGFDAGRADSSRRRRCRSRPS